MGLLKCMVGIVAVALLAVDVTAQHSWKTQSPIPIHRPQQPQISPLPHRPKQQPQQQLKTPTAEVPFEKCQVEEHVKVQCGPQDVTPEQCETINCCFDGHQCYYGKAVTVQCTRDGQFVVVVAKDSTLPHIDVDSISLLETNDDSCSPVGTNSAYAIFQFPVTACGTTMTEERDYVVYENIMSSSYEVGIGPRGSITRDSHFELMFQCKYSATAVEALVIEVHPLPPPESIAAQGPLRAELRLANGKCYNKGCIEEEVAYSSYYTTADYPITKVLREPLYAEVRILERTDPNIVLTLEHCWATSTPEHDSLPQWDLLFDGCPFSDDRYQTKVVPVDGSSGLQYPTHYKRFIVKMFAFVDRETYSPKKDKVFIHCSTAVCLPSSTESCEQPCHRRQRRGIAASALHVSPEQRALVSSGEVILTTLQRPFFSKHSQRSK